MLKFEWDSDKALTNGQKHGIDFELAARVFLDPNRLETYDERYDYDEDRWQIIGMVYPAILVVIYTERGEFIRLISARKANEQERRAYCAVRA